MKILKIIFIVMGMSCCTAINVFAQMTYDEALSEFVAAGIAYTDGRYDTAINQYSKILEGGRVSGPLYYNLGNSYYKKREFGYAILNYERAKQYIPRDSDLNYNKSYAQSRIDQYGDNEALNFIDRAEKSFIQFYTIDEMVIIIVGFVILIGIITLIAFNARLPQSLSNGLIVLFLIGFLLYAAGLFAKVRHDWNFAIIMIRSDSYFEPRSDSTAHFKLSEGMKVRILKSELNWVKIKRMDGKIGWVDRQVLEKI